MLKYLLILLISFSYSASAQEAYKENIEVKIDAPIEDVVVSNLPQCNNKVILQKVLDKIKSYQASKPVNSLVEKRARVLSLKNLTEFSEVVIEDYKHSQGLFIADEIVMVKINKGIKESDMSLCKDNSDRVFLLIYPEKESYRVEILNFVPPTGNPNNFFVTYNPQVEM